MDIKYLGQVFAPENKTTSKGMYVVDRGNGREVIATCYKEGFIKEYLAKGIIKAYPVPKEITDDALPYHPEVWT